MFDYMSNRNAIDRVGLPDLRVHCCLYFIEPTGKGLCPLDVLVMKKLCDRVNLVPIIAKGDSCSMQDITVFKDLIFNDLLENNIQVFKPEGYDGLPFAVVGAEQEVLVGDRKVRGRQYPWGVVEVENESHCDFVKLRNLLIRY
jgi:septin family protein